MTMEQFLIVWALVLVTMLVCRVIPIFILKNREIPEGLQHALNLIPPAAFEALVANDLVSPTMFDGGIWPGVVPLIAAAVVIVYYMKKMNAEVKDRPEDKYDLGARITSYIFKDMFKK